MTQDCKKLEQTWRWYGNYDSISLQEIAQTGATGIVTALHHIEIGSLWTIEEIEKRKKEIEEAGLRWSVVESIPVHEDIKRQIGNYNQYIETYKESLKNLGKCGIKTVCYNFMPVLDWTRTDLEFETADTSTALRFEESALAAFDLYILQRPAAKSSYSDSVIQDAKTYYENLSSSEAEVLTDTILAGLPGSEEGYSLDEFKKMLKSYKGITADDLKNHLYHFLREVIPAAKQAGIKMAIHPDDPPFPLFSLPRVVSTENDVKSLLNVVDSVHNGLTFCTGSFGARADNDLTGMVKRLGHRINFIHLRSVQHESGKSFYEANHLEGSVDIPSVMRAIIEEQLKRKNMDRNDDEIPMRPDHGHKMLDDKNKQSAPGYSCIGRLRGLAELRGLETGIRHSLEIR